MAELIGIFHAISFPPSLYIDDGGPSDQAGYSLKFSTIEPIGDTTLRSLASVAKDFKLSAD